MPSVAVVLLACFWFAASAIAAQADTITGIVTSQETGAGLAEAQVIATASATGEQINATSTALDGTYRLTVPAGTYEVTFTGPFESGYSGVAAHTEVLSAETVVNEALSPSVSFLSPVTSIARISVDAQWQRVAGSSYGPYVSADGEIVAFTSLANLTGAGGTTPGAFVRNALTGVTTRVSEGTVVGLSSDGRYLAVAVADAAAPSYRVYDLETGSVESVDTDVAPLQFGASLSANGRYLAFAEVLPVNGPGYLKLVVDDLVSHTESVVPQPVVGNWEWPTISNNGQFVAFDNGGDPAEVINLANDSIVFNATGYGDGSYVLPKISPDGSEVLFSSQLAGEVHHVYLANIATGKITDLTPSEAGEATANGSWDPTSRYVSFSASAPINGPEARPIGKRREIYVYDTVTGDTTLASTTPTGTVGDDDSGVGEQYFYSTSSLSENAASVAFQSDAANLVPEVPAAITKVRSDVYEAQMRHGTGAAPPIDAPTVTKVESASGPGAGGTRVEITGTELSDASSVQFGTSPAMSFSVTSATSITAIAPPGIGTVNVVVTTPAGLSAQGAGDEFTYIPAPTVVTDDAAAVAETAATLNATVNPNGRSVQSCQFEYGPTTSYGETASCAAIPVAGVKVVGVSTRLAGLAPNTTYNYRVVAAGLGGTSYGSDATFRTNAESEGVVPVRLSVNQDGLRMAGSSYGPYVSASGEITAFTSVADLTGLFASTPGAFVHNALTGLTTRVSDGTVIGLSSDGRYLAVADATKMGFRIYDLETGSADPVSLDSEYGNQPLTYGASLSANGRYLVFAEALPIDGPGSGGHIKLVVYDLALHTETVLPQPAETNWEWPTISNNGQFVAFDNGGNPAEVLDLANDSIVFTAAGYSGDYYVLPKISPDGTKVLFSGAPSGSSGGKHHVYLANLATGGITDLTPSEQGEATANGNWDPSSRYVSFSAPTEVEGEAGSGERQVYVYDTSTETVKLASGAPDGGQGNGESGGGTQYDYATSSLTEGATSAVFQSAATNLVPGDETELAEGYEQELGFVESYPPRTDIYDTTFVQSATPRPTVTKLEPASGPTAGGTTVTISGTELTEATSVKFGSTAATSFKLSSATSITATAPAGTGTVDVTVTTPGGTSATSSADKFSYLPAPTVTTGSASLVTASSGTLNATVNPNGQAVSSCLLEYGPTETYGSTAPCTPSPGSGGSAVSVSAAVSGLGSSSTYHFRISATGPGGTSSGSDASFKTLAKAPTVTKLEPASGPTAGGTTVTITGTELQEATAVKFGSAAATSFKVVSSTSITATAPAGTGTVDVTVTTPGGTSATGSADKFSYLPAPSVKTGAASLVTATSATLGATVNPNGQPVSSCQFEYGPTESYGSTAPCTPTPGSGESPVSVSAPISGLNSSSTYHFRITATGAGGTGSGADATFKTLPKAPTVTKLEPASGPTAGGTTVTITGTELQEATAVKFGSTAAASFKVSGSTSITGVAPAGTGTVDVTVTTPGGTSATGSADKFSYLPAPSVKTGAASLVTATSATLNATVNPNGQPVSSCQFEYGPTESYGSTAPCTPTPGSGESAVSVSAAISALSSNSTYHFRISATGPGGASSGADATFKTAAKTPAVTKVEPSSGPTAGGTAVTISGTELQEATAVKFGSTPATSVKVLSSTSITAVAPAGTGTVDVTVSTPGGTSATSSADKFTYTSSTVLLQFTNWILSGKITPKALGEAITLPKGSTFNGSGELNAETGVGSLTGKVAVPAFSATLKLFGFVPIQFGLTLAQSGALEGTLVKSKTISGDETLTLPLKVNLGITSVGLLGINVPTGCKTTQPISLTLVENLTQEALRTKGWSFTGTTSIPSIKCEGGLLGSLFGEMITPTFSGPEAAYSISVTAP